jgi:multidrug resistance protein MdtO
MAALPESKPQRGPFFEMLFAELAPREGRALAVVHMATACAITVAIAMVFRIPEPTYMAYIVFLISKDDKGATVTTGLGGQIAVTLAVLLMLGLMMVDLSEPGLRLPVMALVTFLAMYTVRTFVLGPITYLAGFVAVMLQSVVDDVPNPEALTRLSLWMWVVLLVPIVITILLNLLFAPGTRLLAERTAKKVLTELEAALLRGAVSQRLSHWQEITVALLSKKIVTADTRSRISPAVIRRLVDVLVMLEVLPADISPTQRQALAARVRACRNSLDGDTAPVETHSISANDTPSPNILALDDALQALEREITQPSADQAPAAAHAKHSPFTPDAFTNPAHWQFAAKTTFAVMVVYAVYTLLDWPGMRTSIVTCFFVGLGSLGETVHKLTLRISGALIGGLISGLCIVFVLPHMTDIGQLSALIFVVSAGAAWIATSSERLSYAGLQIAFAFFLGILQDYAPANDLTVLRDRVAGIVLGNIVMAVIFSALWPESATTRLRTVLADLLRKIGILLQGQENAEDARAGTAQALVQANHYREISHFELNMLASRVGVRPKAGLSTAGASPGPGAEPDLMAARSSPGTDPLAARFSPRADLERLTAAARRVAGAAFVATTTHSEPLTQETRRAAENLLSEIEHAAAP